MNKLSDEMKNQILSMLVEGMSIRSIERITGTHRDTIMRLSARMGKVCERLFDENMRNFHSRYLEADEIWTFCYKKEKRLKGKEIHNTKMGDQYVFIALDPESKLIPVFTVGKRNIETTRFFMSSLKRKLNGNGRIQLTTDQFRPYENVIDECFGCDIDYAQQTKFYVNEPDSRGRYSPPRVAETVSRIVQGNPNKKKISTSLVERHNLTLRMQLRRFTRLTNAFSKKLENLKASVALYFFHYNFMRVHSSIRMTPAMEAGITNSIWSWKDIITYDA